MIYAVVTIAGILLFVSLDRDTREYVGYVLFCKVPPRVTLTILRYIFCVSIVALTLGSIWALLGESFWQGAFYGGLGCLLNNIADDFGFHPYTLLLKKLAPKLHARISK